jgi:hypothetical protein
MINNQTTQNRQTHTLAVLSLPNAKSRKRNDQSAK